MKCPLCGKAANVIIPTDVIGQAYCKPCRYPFPLDPADLAKQLAKEAVKRRETVQKSKPWLKGKK